MASKFFFGNLVFFLILGLPFVQAFSVDVWSNKVSITELYSSNEILTNGDLRTNAWMFFFVPENFTNTYRNLTISFNPWEHITFEPIEDVVIEICNQPGSWGWNPDTGYDDPCSTSYNFSVEKRITERNFVHDGLSELRNYSTFSVVFSPPDRPAYSQYMFRIRYTTPHFISKQGDYSVAWLNFPDMQNKGYHFENSLVLPTQDDIPRFIPDAYRITRMFYRSESGLHYRWAFYFKGGEEKIIWYSNEKEIEDKERALQEEYTNKGVWRGFWLSLAVAFFVIFVERFFFDWTPFGNRILAWLTQKFRPMQVIGNKNNKKYHTFDCSYLDNIDRDNRITFRDKEEARKENYVPCSVCNR